MGCSPPLSNAWKASRRKPSTNFPLSSVTTTPTFTLATLTRLVWLALTCVSWAFAHAPINIQIIAENSGAETRRALVIRSSIQPFVEMHTARILPRTPSHGMQMPRKNRGIQIVHPDVQHLRFLRRIRAPGFRGGLGYLCLPILLHGRALQLLQVVVGKTDQLFRELGPRRS